MSFIEIMLVAILCVILFFGLLWSLLLFNISDDIKKIRRQLKETYDLLERIRSHIYTKI